MKTKLRDIVMENTNSTTLKSMRLSNSTIEIVKKLAKEENRNFSNMVETIIMRSENVSSIRSNDVSKTSSKKK